jgi:tol-pal system protein YbgF
MRAAVAALLALPLLGGCLATQKDVRDLRAEMMASQQSQDRQIQEVLRRTEALLDSLSDQNVRMRGDLATRLVSIERQLVQIQELTGQGQQQLNQLRQQINRREEDVRRAQQAAADSADAPAAGADGEDPQGIYDQGQAALRRGSMSAARTAFEEFLRIAPGHRLAADAQFGIAESYAQGRDPVRAIQAFARVTDTYPTSTRAPAALLRIAQIELERGNRTQGRARLTRLLRDYPRASEVAEARRLLARAED